MMKAYGNVMKAIQDITDPTTTAEDTIKIKQHYIAAVTTKIIKAVPALKRRNPALGLAAAQKVSVDKRGGKT